MIFTTEAALFALRKGMSPALLQIEAERRGIPRPLIDVVAPAHKLHDFVDDKENDEEKGSHDATILSVLVRKLPFDGYIVSRAYPGCHR